MSRELPRIDSPPKEEPPILIRESAQYSVNAPKSSGRSTSPVGWPSGVWRYFHTTNPPSAQPRLTKLSLPAARATTQDANTVGAYEGTTVRRYNGQGAAGDWQASADCGIGEPEKRGVGEPSRKHREPRGIGEPEVRGAGARSRMQQAAGSGQGSLLSLWSLPSLLSRGLNSLNGLKGLTDEVGGREPGTGNSRQAATGS